MRHGDLGDLDQLQRFAAEPLDKEDLWKQFQAHIGYTDAEMAVFRSDPLKVKMVTESPEFMKSRIVAEVIESHGCHAHHTLGQKFDMDGNGQMITRECPEKRCIFALAALENPVIQIYERFIAHSDPNNERSIDAASSSQAFTVIAGPPGTAAV